MSTIKEQLQYNLKDAMRRRDKEEVNILRLILASIKQKEVDDRIELDDAMLVALFDKLAKQRRESIALFEMAQRQDLVEKEQYELSVILSYLPKQLTDAEIDELVQASIEQVGAQSIKDMGKLMAVLKPQLQGRADMAKVSSLIKKQLE